MKQQKKAILNLLAILILCLNIPTNLGFAEDESTPDIPIEIASTNSDTISMSLDGALLKDVLLLFSQQSGLNFVASQEVEGKKVTVYFENVSPKDALSAIITANGLTYTKKPGSDIYLVIPQSKTQPVELITKVIRLKYMRLSESPLDVGGKVTISDLAKSASASTSSSSSSSSDSSSSSSSSTTETAQKGADVLVQKFLSAQGKVATSLHTNSLIITDTAESLAAIEKILAQIDVPPSQVILEVHVMEVSKTLASDIGVDWGGSDGALASFQSGKRTTTFPFLERPFNQNKGVKPQIFVNELGTTDNELSALQYGILDATNFSAILRYVQSDAKTKILARPRVLTQNNEAAAIRLVTNQAVGSQSTSSGEGAGASTTTEAERAEVGISMRLTPQINDDGTVLLFLEPSVSTASASQFFPDDFVDTTTRLVRTMARIKDNQTLVIGGLIDGQNTEIIKKIPLLGDIPMLGKAFRYDEVDNTDRELLIFVTPHIVKGATSLGPKSATAVGEDLSMKRILEEFKDKEMLALGDTYQNFENTKRNFVAKEDALIKASEQRYSNPVVEKQMSQALDSLNSQSVENKMSSIMDSLSSKK